MATKGGCIDYMFLAPPPGYPATGSATGFCSAMGVVDLFEFEDEFLARVLT